jgi:hypothetical protein
MLNWLRKEFLEILPVWAFFFLSFGLVALIRNATFGEYHIQPSEPPEYLVGSLIMAKVVLLIDAFMKDRGRHGRPLIYHTLLNTGLYFLAALAFLYLEHTITLIRHRHVGLAEAGHEVLVTMEKPLFGAIMLGVLALTFGFCMIRELIRGIGFDRFMEMFFGRRPPTGRTAEDIRRVS